jgi:hypothetical protein
MYERAIPLEKSISRERAKYAVKSTSAERAISREKSMLL